jgi:hypothetical protein
VTDREHILCVNHYGPLLESGCRVLQAAGYDTVKAAPQASETLLTSQKFDLIVISHATELEINFIAGLSDGAEFLVLDEFVSPSELVAQVAERLRHLRVRRA